MSANKGYSTAIENLITHQDSRTSGNAWATAENSEEPWDPYPLIDAYGN